LAAIKKTLIDTRPQTTIKMSREKIFNIFPIVIDEIISSIGYKTHLVKGDDDYKIDFLKENINNDLKDLKYISIPMDFNISKGKIKKME